MDAQAVDMVGRKIVAALGYIETTVTNLDAMVSALPRNPLDCWRVRPLVRVDGTRRRVRASQELTHDRQTRERLWAGS
jgi:hypothetical protein